MQDMQDRGSALPTIREVGIDQAIGWFSGGWALFRKAPGVWIGMLLVYVVMAIVAGLIPFVGSLAFSLLAPVFTLGWLIGAKELDAGSQLTVGHLFAGFRSPRMGSLVLLGLLSLAIGVGLGVLAGLGVFGILIGGGDVVEPEKLGAGVLLLIPFILLGMLLLVAAFIFATPLVGFTSVSPLDAIKLSLRATVKNGLALLVWGLIALVLLVVGSIPLGLGLLVVGPLLGAAYYLMYRDIFE